MTRDIKNEPMIVRQITHSFDTNTEGAMSPYPTVVIVTITK